MQGAPAGIVASAQSGITSLAQLAGKEGGVATPTAMEYIYDKALTDAGVPEDQIKTTELKDLGVRLQMVESGQVAAAVLPWTLFQLAVDNGGVPLLDVDAASPLTASLLTFRYDWLTAPGNGDAITTLLRVWNTEVAKINADPDAYREVLAQQANLPSPLDTTYKVRQYPTAALPDETQYNTVLDWMRAKGYLTTDMTYDDLVWPEPAK
jgi:NitT/TauT family transport system substrate-binding protein